MSGKLAERQEAGRARTSSAESDKKGGGRSQPSVGAMRELAVACIFYMVCSAGMSVFNKLAVRVLPLPITLVCVQMVFTIVSVGCRPKSVHIGSLRDALRWGLTVPLLSFAAMLAPA